MPTDEEQMPNDVKNQLDKVAKENGNPATPKGKTQLAVVVLKGDTYRGLKPICRSEAGELGVIIVFHGKLRLSAAGVNINCQCDVPKGYAAGLAWEELHGMCIQRTIPREHDDSDAE